MRNLSDGGRCAQASDSPISDRKVDKGTRTNCAGVYIVGTSGLFGNGKAVEIY